MLAAICSNLKEVCKGVNRLHIFRFGAGVHTHIIVSEDVSNVSPTDSLRLQ